MNELTKPKPPKPIPSRIKKWTRRILIALTSLVILYYVVTLFAVWLWGDYLILRPTGFSGKTPGSYGVPFEEIHVPFSSKDNPSNTELLKGYLIPGEGTHLDRTLIVFFHGNALNIEANFNRVLFYRPMGTDVALIEYAGYGRGERPSENDLIESSVQAVEYLIQERKYVAGRVFLHGHSMGAAAAIQTAKRLPQLGGLIIEAGFTSMVEMIAKQSWTPWGFLSPIQLRSLETIPDITIPKLILHGEGDQLIPVEMGKRLYEAANPSKRLELFSCGHNDIFQSCFEPYIRAIEEFIGINRR